MTANELIAERMFDTNVDLASGEKRPFPAGYTYLGQFISHDIVPSTMQRTLSRNVSGYMNLESLYGSSPLYQYKFQPESLSFFEENGKFKTNETHEYDLPRKCFGDKKVAHIPEARNDENQIVAQLHVVFMRLHNHLITKELAKDALEARLYTTLIFQLVVIEDFLPKLLTAKVYEAIFGKNSLSIYEILARNSSPISPTCFIPTIFSHASWRFGHSTALTSYHISNPIDNAKLSALLQSNSAIPEIRQISWKLFFKICEHNPQFADPIDTRITSEMKGVEGAYFKHNIVSLNLSAAERMELPSGKDMFNRLKATMGSDQMFQLLGIQPIQYLNNTRFENIAGLNIENLPLWLYILLEAEINEQSLGKSLGPLGSLINALVIKKSIMGADISVYDKNQYSYSNAVAKLGKRLPEEAFIKEQKITMANLIRFINED